MKPFLIMTFGHTAAGKTTVAKKLSKELQTELVSSAEITQRLLPEMTSIDDYIFGTPSNKKKNEVVYNEISSQVKKLAEEGKNIVVDAFFPFRKYRDELYSLEKAGYDILILECICNDKDTVRKRLEDRISGKDMVRYLTEKARSMEVYHNWLEHIEPLDDDVLPSGKPPQIVRYNTLMNEVDFTNFSAKMSSHKGINGDDIITVLKLKKLNEEGKKEEDLEKKIHDYGRRGFWYLSCGERTNAENSIKEALKLNPGSIDANICAAMFYNEVGETEKALEYHKKTTELFDKAIDGCGFFEYTEHDELLEFMGFMLKKDYHKAARAGELYVGKCNWRLKHKKSVDFMTLLTFTHFMMMAYGKLEDYKKLRDCCEISLRLEGDDPITHNMIGSCYSNMIDKAEGLEGKKETIEKAILHLERALELGPGRRGIHGELIPLYYHLARIVEMYDSYDFQEIDPFGDTGPFSVPDPLSSPSLSVLKIYERLKLHSEIALKYHPDNPTLNLIFGESLCMLGRIDEGIPHLEKAGEIEMNRTCSKDLGVWYLMYSMSLNKAQEYFEKKIKHAERNHREFIKDRLESIKLLKSCNDTIFEEARKWMREQTKDNLSLQLHLERTLEEVIANHPFKDPAPQLRIAAMMHDIERAFPGRLHRKDFPSTEEGRNDYKRLHALRSAEIARKLVEDITYKQFNAELAGHLRVTGEMCYLLIAAHEDAEGYFKYENRGSLFVNMANLLMFADTLVFFRYDFNEYLKNKELEAVEEKVNFMFDRILKERRDAEVHSKFEICTKRLAEAYRKKGYEEKADELLRKIESYDQAVKGKLLYLVEK